MSCDLMLAKQILEVIEIYEICCAQEIDCKSVAARCLKLMEVFGTSWLSQLQNHLQNKFPLQKKGTAQR